MPIISVVIPTRNRANLLAKALESLSRQHLSLEYFEVIVIDNGSTDNTKEVCDNSLNNALPNLRYYYDSKPGLHIGRHLGLKMSRSEIITYGDDDIEALPTWLNSIADTFQDPAVSLVGGKILPLFESEPPNWFDSLWLNLPWGRVSGFYTLIDFGDQVCEISPYYVWGANFSIRKEILLESGGFHPDGMPKEMIRFRGDGETAVSRVIQQKGLKTIYNPATSVYHWTPDNKFDHTFLYNSSYSRGISASFTDIRARGGVSQGKSMGDYARQFRSLGSFYFRNLGRKIYPVNKVIRAGYIEGYNFHQQEVRNDPELLAWVLKDNYLED